MSLKVAIIGSGLSGLACGVELKRNGAEVTVFESSSSVGGRIKTDEVEGFLLDHGFQVFLPSYDLAPHFLNYKELDLHSFSPGAYIYKDDKFGLIADPLRQPSQLLATLFSSVATFKDKLLTLKLICGRKIKYKNIKSNKSALEFLKEFGFSSQYIENFFIPFFSGVFLNRELSASADFFKYLFDRFSKSYASLPAKGMHELPIQMAKEIGLENIKLNQKIDLLNFNKNDFDEIVQAYMPKEMDQDHYSVTTCYYKTQSKKWAGKTLYLNGNSVGPVNHVACLTGVNPNYAPSGWHLYSVNLLNSDTSKVNEHLEQLFGKEEIASWELIKTFTIEKALPSKPKYSSGELQNTDGVYLCGDYLESPSIQGALVSGAKIARKILGA